MTDNIIQEKAQRILDDMGPITVTSKVDRMVRLLADRSRCTTRLIEVQYTDAEFQDVENMARTLALRLAKMA